MNHIPDGLHNLTLSLNLSDASAAMEFYTRAFGAVERFRMPTPDGKVMHGEFQIGETVVMFCDEAPDWGALSPMSVGGCPVSLTLYFEDCDAAYQKAIEAGAESEREPATYPWGERSSMVRDPFGFRWSICTHLEDLEPEEIERRMKESGMG